MFVEYLNQRCATFFFNMGCSDTSDSVKCHEGSLTYISAPYVLILCITRDSIGHLEKDRGPYEVHHCSRATASDRKINFWSVTPRNQNPLKVVFTTQIQIVSTNILLWYKTIH